MAKDHEQEAAGQPVDEAKLSTIAKRIFAMPPEPRKKAGGRKVAESGGRKTPAGEKR